MQKCKYKDCKRKATALSEYCWQHIEDKEGYKNILSEHIKKERNISGFHLRGAQMPNMDFSEVNCSQANFTSCDLSGANFTNANMKECHLAYANLQEADLTNADLSGAHLFGCKLQGARLWHTDLREANLVESNLSKANLLNANLSFVKIWHAQIRSAVFLTRNNFIYGKSFLGIDKFCIDEKGPFSAAEGYRILKQYFMANGRYDDASWASYKEKQMQRRHLLKRKSIAYIPSLFMGAVCGYGEKPYRVIISSLSMILIFALLYFFLGAAHVTSGIERALNLWDYLYFSIVTFTTLGYGDIVPRPSVVFQFLAGAEAFSGAFMIGLFVFTLARKYSAR